MSDTEVPASPPESALVSQSVTCHVVGVRPPEPAVARRFGEITQSESDRFGAQVACMTTHMARRAEVAGLVRPASTCDCPDPLSGALPPWGGAQRDSAGAV